MEFQDKSLTCSECGAEFVFTAGEQQFYQEKGFAHEPRRCKTCRSRRKGGAGDGRTSDGGRGVHGSAPRSDSEGGRGQGGFTATCSACGGVARLTFQPSPNRPVYCRSCYQGRSGSGGR